MKEAKLFDFNSGLFQRVKLKSGSLPVIIIFDKRCFMVDVDASERESELHYKEVESIEGNK